MDDKCVSCSIDGVYILWDIYSMEVIHEDRLDKIVKVRFDTDRTNYILVNIQDTKL